MKPIITWVLLADTAMARIVEHRGRGTALRQLPGRTLNAPDAMEYADQEGRGQNSISAARYKLEKHSEVSRNHEEFARNILQDIKLGHQKHEFDRLIICAAPTMLGILRRHLPGALESDLIAEVSKDLTHVPTADLAKHFTNLLPV